MDLVKRLFWMPYCEGRALPLLQGDRSIENETLRPYWASFPKIIWPQELIGYPSARAVASIWSRRMREKDPMATYFYIRQTTRRHEASVMAWGDWDCKEKKALRNIEASFEWW
jgi:hypothetical protein